MYIVFVSKVVVRVLSYALIFSLQRNARNLMKVKTLWTRKLNKVAVIPGSMEDFHLVKDFNLNSTSTESLYQHIFNSKLNIFYGELRNPLAVAKSKKGFFTPLQL